MTREIFCLPLKCTADLSCLSKCFHPPFFKMKLTVAWNNWLTLFLIFLLVIWIVILQFLSALDHSLWWLCVCFKYKSTWNCKGRRSEGLRHSTTSQWMGGDRNSLNIPVLEEHSQEWTDLCSSTCLPFFEGHFNEVQIIKESLTVPHCYFSMFSKVFYYFFWWSYIQILCLEGAELYFNTLLNLA